MAPNRAPLVTLAVLALLAPLASATRRELLVDVLDDKGQPIVDFDPKTVSYNFTEGDIRGTWQINETDPRINPELYDGIGPEQIKILYYSPSEVLLTWITGKARTALAPLERTNHTQGVTDVELTTPDNNVLYYTGSVTTYDQVYYGFPNATNYTSGLIHRVRVGGLQPGETYQYRVGALEEGIWSETLNFTQPGGFNAYPLRIGLVADGGQTYNSSTTYEHLLASQPDVVHFVGDLTYADNRHSDGDYYGWNFNTSYPVEQLTNLTKLVQLGTYQPRWDTWGRLVEPLTSSIPFLFNNGNHEIETQSNGVQHASYLARVPPNYADSGSSDPLYYSVDVGPAHFVFLSSYAPYNETTDQFEWLVQDLAGVDRDDTPWLIVNFHAPWYNSYRAHYQENECMRLAVEDVLNEYGVDLVFSGHVHAYERSFPVRNFTLDDTAPVYITIGDGGNVEKLEAVFADLPGNCPASNKTSGPAYQPEICIVKHYDGQFCSDGQPEWSAFREPAFGFATLDILNETHAHYQWHRNQDPEPVVSDDVYFVRNEA